MKVEENFLDVKRIINQKVGSHSGSAESCTYNVSCHSVQRGMFLQFSMLNQDDLNKQQLQTSR